MKREQIVDEAGDSTKLLRDLQNTARASRTHIAKCLLETGLYAGQETVMELLDQRDGQTLGEIAAALGVRPPTVTRTISRLQEQQFVDRRASDVDARLVHVWLTDNGRAVLRQMHASIAYAETSALGGLKKKERKQLARILAKIDASLADDALPKKSRKSGSAKSAKKKKP